MDADPPRILDNVVVCLSKQKLYGHRHFIDPTPHLEKRSVIWISCTISCLDSNPLELGIMKELIKIKIARMEKSPLGIYKSHFNQNQKEMDKSRQESSH